MCEQANADNNSVRAIFTSLCRCLADNSETVGVSKEFAALSSNSSRVAVAHDLLRRYGLFPRNVGNFKNSNSAFRLRQEGNNYFKVKNDYMALLSYTKCIANAPNDDKNLSLAYANRSAVFFEKKLYQECLKDIEYAFLHNYPQDLYEKLLQRKTKSEALVSDQSPFIYHEVLPSLSSESNQVIECAGDCIEIKCDKDLGRHIVATKNIMVGDVIARENPFCQILLKENYFTHCYECLRPCYNLIACDNCPLVMFCGDHCKQKSWNLYHKYECLILSTLIDLGVGKLTLVALKICIDVRNIQNVIEFNSHELLNQLVYKSENYLEIHNLISNTQFRSTADLFERAITAAIIFELVEKHTPFFNDHSETKNIFQELLLLHMQTGPSNFHEISELVKLDNGFFENNEVGSGAYGFLSLLNHSCSPNVVRHCYGSCIVLRALRPISKGEQLLDNYGYHHAVMPRNDRFQYLKDQYCFDCQCEACTHNWKLYQNLHEINFDIGIDEEEITSLRNGNVQVAKQCLKKLPTLANALEKSKPCKELADVQEILKQCYAVLGNRRAVF